MKINNIILILFVLILIISVILYCFLYNNNFNDVTSDLVEGFGYRGRRSNAGSKGGIGYYAPAPSYNIAHASPYVRRHAQARAMKHMAHTPTQYQQYNNGGHVATKSQHKHQHLMPPPQEIAYTFYQP